MIPLRHRDVFCFLLISVLFLINSITVFPQQAAPNSPAPYTKNEFPSWALDIRRADIVAFGSLPFTVFFTTFAVDSYRFATHNWDRLYAPWPLRAAGAIEMDENQRIASFSVALGLSVTIALVDYFIVRHKRAKYKEFTPPLPQPEIIVEPWSPDQGSSQE